MKPYLFTIIPPDPTYNENILHIIIKNIMNVLYPYSITEFEKLISKIWLKQIKANSNLQ